MQLLDWVSDGPRSYAETLDAWKTHCPRLSTWEDAVAAGFVSVTRANGESRVVLTEAGASARRRALV